jgi:hypothetical protein
MAIIKCYERPVSRLSINEDNIYTIGPVNEKIG